MVTHIAILTINQNHKLSLVISDNDYSKIEIRQRIMEATLDLNKGYYTLMTERMSVNNADILAKFVNSNRHNGHNVHGILQMKFTTMLAATAATELFGT